MQRGALVLLLVGLNLLPAPARAQAEALRERMGFSSGYLHHQTLGEIEQELDAIAGMGRWFRGDCAWSLVETQPPDTTLNGIERHFDWDDVDDWVGAARARGLEVILLLTYAPSWARPEAFQDSVWNPETYFGGPHLDRGEDWGRFCAEAAARYRLLGVHHYQIWNEPNAQSFFTTNAETLPYPELLRIGAQAVRGADPAAVILSGGMMPVPHTVTYGADSLIYNKVSSHEWLRALYEYEYEDSTLDVRDFFDAVDYHPYARYEAPAWAGPLHEYTELGPVPKPFLHHPVATFLFTEDLYRIMCEYGDSGKRIWATEVGKPTGHSRTPGVSNPEQERVQRDWVDDYMSRWMSWDFTGPLIWFSIRDRAPRDPYTCCYDFYGVIRWDWSEKPAFDELRKWATGGTEGPGRSARRPAVDPPRGR
jgi:polysaccharide biosynthesis protein PslG